MLLHEPDETSFELCNCLSSVPDLLAKVVQLLGMPELASRENVLTSVSMLWVTMQTEQLAKCPAAQKQA